MSNKGTEKGGSAKNSCRKGKDIDRRGGNRRNQVGKKGKDNKLDEGTL